MRALATHDLDAAERLMTQTAAIGVELVEPDVEAVLHELAAMRALAASDSAVLADEALAHEEFGSAEGIPSVIGCGWDLWLAIGQVDRAASVVTQLMANGVAGLARDVDFLLVLSPRRRCGRRSRTP